SNSNVSWSNSSAIWSGSSRRWRRPWRASGSPAPAPTGTGASPTRPGGCWTASRSSTATERGGPPTPRPTPHCRPRHPSPPPAFGHLVASRTGKSLAMFGPGSPMISVVDVGSPTARAQLVLGAFVGEVAFRDDGHHLVALPNVTNANVAETYRSKYKVDPSDHV